MLNIIHDLQEFNTTSILFRLLLSLILGMFVGSERNRQGKPAGMKTHSLVCMGATLIMLLAEFASKKYNVTDITRLGAQVISGVGFLGAGTILTTKLDDVKGLTSAAGIWFSACLGLAIGLGFYTGGIMAFCCETFVFIYFSKRAQPNNLYQQFQLFVQYSSSFKISELIHLMNTLGVKILQVDDDIFHSFNEIGKYHNAVVVLRITSNVKPDVLIHSIEHLDGIKIAQEIL